MKKKSKTHEDASGTMVAAPKQQQQMIPQTTAISNIKLPILKKEEYDILPLWRWRIILSTLIMKYGRWSFPRTHEKISWNGCCDSRYGEAIRNRFGEAGKQEKNQMGLLTMDDGIVNWGEHTEAEETNHALMAISSSNEANEIYEKDEKLKRYRRIGMKAVKEKEQLQKIVDSWKDSSKNLWRLTCFFFFLFFMAGVSNSKVGLGFEIQSNNEVLSYEEEMNFSVFKCSKEDSIGKPSYSRFTKTNDFKGVPHPLSGDYTPKPQEEIDDSLYVYGKKGPQKPEISVSDDNSSEHSTFGDLLLRPQQVIIEGTIDQTSIITEHPLKNMVDRGIFDSGCSGHMTCNKNQLEDFEEFNGGHKVLFTETECLVVSSDFKMPDENQILLKVPRYHNMYSFDIKTPSPAKGFACLIAKATSDESKLWHRWLGVAGDNDFNSLPTENEKAKVSEHNQSSCSSQSISKASKKHHKDSQHLFVLPCFLFFGGNLRRRLLKLYRCPVGFKAIGRRNVQFQATTVWDSCRSSSRNKRFIKVVQKLVWTAPSSELGNTPKTSHLNAFKRVLQAISRETITWVMVWPKEKEKSFPLSVKEILKSSKEKQISQEEVEASLAEAIRLDSLQKEEEAKQIHLDSLLAQMIIAEEEELNEEQKKRKAKFSFEVSIHK
ncbi:hypothetical protein Tco_0077879 [Tanacetum coccineum]